MRGLLLLTGFTAWSRATANSRKAFARQTLHKEIAVVRQEQSEQPGPARRIEAPAFCCRSSDTMILCPRSLPPLVIEAISARSIFGSSCGIVIGGETRLRPLRSTPSRALCAAAINSVAAAVAQRGGTGANVTTRGFRARRALRARSGVSLPHGGVAIVTIGSRRAWRQLGSVRHR
jgi:hypothetical protein